MDVSRIENADSDLLYVVFGKSIILRRLILYPMSRSLLPLLILLLPLSLAAQHRGLNSPDSTAGGTPLTPYDPHAHYRTWSLKGKVLPFFLGDFGGISGLFGVEYGITKNQSIGVDGFLELQENSDDGVQDTAGVQHTVGNWINITIRCIR